MTDIHNSQHNQSDIEDEEFALLDARLSRLPKGQTHFASPCDIPLTICRRAALKNLDIQYALENLQTFIDKFESEFNTIPSELEQAAAVLQLLLALDQRKAASHD